MFKVFAFVRYSHFIIKYLVASQSILVGTRSGDIYEFIRPKESELKAKDAIVYENLIINRLVCNDHQVPKSVSFSNTCDRIFGITQTGSFNVWDLKTLQLIYSKIFERSTVALITFKNKQLLLIAFEYEVKIYKVYN